MTTTLSRASTDRRFDLLSLGTFIILGLPDGMLGTAWPAMRQSFGVPVGDLGLILLVNTIGSVAVAAFVGRLIQRLGVSALLAVAGTCAAIGGIGYAAAPGLWLVLAIGPLLGAAAGMMDGGLNTAVALTGRPRLLNLLHGFYGIGTAIGPLVVTAAILAGSWRPPTCSWSPSTSPPPSCGPCITARPPHPRSLARPPVPTPVSVRT